MASKMVEDYLKRRRMESAMDDLNTWNHQCHMQRKETFAPGMLAVHKSHGPVELRYDGRIIAFLDTRDSKTRNEIVQAASSLLRIQKKWGAEK